MKQILLLYQSHTGFTRRYAQWMGEALGIPPVSLGDCTRDRIREADLIIFGGSVRGSVISGRARVERLCRRAGGKPVLWFGVGLRPNTPRTMELLRKNNFPGEVPALFYFRGGMAPEGLTPGDRTLVTCYRAMMKRQSRPDPEDWDLLSLLAVPCDYAGPEQIRPLIRAVKERIL